MDILDILIAKKKSFTGETEKLVRDANAAMAKANEVAEKIEDAEDLLEQAQSAATTANAASATAQQAAADLETMEENITAAAQEVVEESIAEAKQELEEQIDDKVTAVTVEDDNTASYKSKKIRVRKKNTNDAYNLMKNYTTTGSNEDGSMTQKAITAALENISQTGGPATIDLGSANAGKIVVVKSDGGIEAGNVTEAEIIESLIESSTYTARNAVGLEIDYTNKDFNRTQEAYGLLPGSDFNKYPMYGGRKRCIVDREGRIVAWYGDNNYVEDGSLGQVMIYQPKFYYNRAILSSENNSGVGRIVRKETLLISATNQAGFKLHPLFKDENGNEIDYVLLPAYESTYYDTSANTIITNDASDINPSEDYLLSAAGIKPISGVNKTFTINVAEQMAQNIGTGWHITNMAAESANQMLEIVEFGQMNGQAALEDGIVNINHTKTYNSASITGSTSSLGNTTGHAEETINEYNGVYTTYSEAGKRAISYRGFENPWGNIYRFIGGINLFNDRTLNGGKPYVATDYNYTPGVNGNNYDDIGFTLPADTNWVSAMGIGKTEYDWIYLPAEAKNASSLLPVGDYLWVNNFSGYNLINIGGTQNQHDNCGLFYYGCDLFIDRSSSVLSARIMHIPTKNSLIYNANIASWNQKMGA